MTAWLIPLLLLLALGIALIVGLGRATELFVLVTRAGRVEVLRGRVPPRLLRDISDVVRSAGFRRQARLRVVVEDGRAVWRYAGDPLPAPVKQRLRNILALWPVAKIRAAPKR